MEYMLFRSFFRAGDKLMSLSFFQRLLPVKRILFTLSPAAPRSRTAPAPGSAWRDTAPKPLRDSADRPGRARPARRGR